MSITCEDVILQVGEVRINDNKVSLGLLKDQVIWVEYPHEVIQFSILYEKIRKLIIPAEGESKIQLEIVLYDNASLFVHFVNSSGREAQTLERDLVKKHLDKLLLKFNSKQEQEERMRKFSENPFLWKLYKRLVVVQGISEEEFWTQHPLFDLIASDDKYRDECNNKRQRLIDHPELNDIIIPDNDDIEEFSRYWNYFFSFYEKIQSKTIIHPYGKEFGYPHKIKMHFPETYTSLKRSIPNDEESWEPPTKRAKTETNEDLEQESTKLLSFSPLEPSLCGLPTEHVLLPCILIHLDIRDLLNLSQTHRHMESVVISYLSKMETLDFSKRWEEPISDEQFTILHENCRNIRELNFNKCYWLKDSQSKPLILNNISHLEKVMLKHCEFETVELLTACRNLKSVKLFSYGLYILTLNKFVGILCEYNLNLDHVFITNGNRGELKYWSKICIL